MERKATEMGLAILCEIAQQEIELQSYIDETRGDEAYRDERLVAEAKIQLCNHLSEFIGNMIKSYVYNEQ